MKFKMYYSRLDQGICTFCFLGPHASSVSVNSTATTEYRLANVSKVQIKELVR